jgi:hypothetical protein
MYAMLAPNMRAQITIAARAAIPHMVSAAQA